VPRFKKHASQKWLHLQCRECPSWRVKKVCHDPQLLGIPGLSKWFFKSVDEAVVPQKTFGVSESRMKVYTARWFEGNS
jgi:hypothetical protein